MWLKVAASRPISSIFSGSGTRSVKSPLAINSAALVMRSTGLKAWLASTSPPKLPNNNASGIAIPRMSRALRRADCTAANDWPRRMK